MRRTALLIFSVALAARLVTSALQILRPTYGVLWVPFLTLWSDFHGLYVNQLSNISNGMIPYRDFAYSYTPLFIYSLYPFYAIGGSTYASIPILLADSLTGPLVYLCLQLKTTDRVAIIGGLSYSILPFFLVYEGYLWLSSQPMTLFIVLGIYFANKGKYEYSALTLALAVMFKQEAFFMLPPCLVFYARKLKTGIWKVLAILVMVFLLISLPFLVTSASDYLASISYGEIGIVFQSFGNGKGNTFITNSSTFIQTNQSCESVSTIIPTPHTNCVYSYISYPNPFFAYILNFLNGLGQWTTIPLLALLGVAILLSLRNSNILEISSAYSITILLFAFSQFIGPMHRYYLVPVYALLLMSSRSYEGILITVLASSVSLFSVPGAFQFLPVILSGLLLLAQQEVMFDQNPST